MNIESFILIANKYIKEYNLELDGWKLKLKRKINYLGLTRDKRRADGSYTREIIMSAQFIEHCPEYLVIEVFLHELAHAIVGVGNVHNKIWKDKCRELGIEPKTSYDITQWDWTT